MQMNAAWSPGGRSLRIRFTVSGWLLRIFSPKPAAQFQLSLDGDLVQNKKGFLVRDGLPLETTSVRTAPAPRLGLTSRSAHYRLGSSRPRGAVSH